MAIESELEKRREALFGELRSILARFAVKENADASNTLANLNDIDVEQNDDIDWESFKDIIRQYIDLFDKIIRGEKVSFPNDLVIRARDFVAQNRNKQKTVVMSSDKKDQDKANGRVAFFAFMNNSLNFPIQTADFFTDLKPGDEDLVSNLDALRKCVPYR